LESCFPAYHCSGAVAQRNAKKRIKEKMSDATMPRNVSDVRIFFMVVYLSFSGYSLYYNITLQFKK
jgi:hypothetical protein